MGVREKTLKPVGLETNPEMLPRAGGERVQVRGGAAGPHLSLPPAAAQGRRGRPAPREDGAGRLLYRPSALQSDRRADQAIRIIDRRAYQIDK